MFGALLLALEHVGATVNGTVFRRLEQTCPDEALFLTRRRHGRPVHPRIRA
ncbi:hypothetical protein [Deinococcus aerophilus]|uniref:Uncharacterized protein n=1 Tax=Deinococcus aerophilus TaxID=522488 RepID=A0ABQ2GYX0_9DEIO|nr:hypothetical protein [Deinococcus aerophilus]GGM20687.1 hypothetical protein GCM10010841_30870 [Deinococcus aerophilus]